MASIQEQCCPDPSLSVIPEDEDTKPVRKSLHLWYYSQYGYIIALMVTQSIVKGIFGLFNVWIAYLCYSTMSFCQCFLYMFILGIETVFCVMLALSYPAPFNIILWFMVVYNVVGLCLMYRAYGVFQKK